MNADFVLINFSEATKFFPTKSPLKVLSFFMVFCATHVHTLIITHCYFGVQYLHYHKFDKFTIAIPQNFT